MGFRKETGNRALNTVGIVPRTLGTGFHTILDATKTALYCVLDPIDGLGQTAGKIKDAIHKSFTEGSFRKKLWKAPVSLATSPLMLAEGVVETLLNTGYNLCKNTRDTIANPFINFGHGIKRLGSKQPVGAFSFEKIENKSIITPKNYLANLF